MAQAGAALSKVPTAMKALHGHDIWAEQMPAVWSWAAHLVFGLGLAVFPWVQGKLASPAQ